MTPDRLMDMNLENVKRKGNKKNWKKNILRCACCNIRSWNGREQEVLLEMEKHYIDICTLSETKRKSKGDLTYPKYCLKYSGKEQAQRASAGVGMLVSTKYIQNIEETHYINERILRVVIDGGKEKLHFISVYAPDTNKSNEEIKGFYDDLQAEIEKVPKEHKIVILGDMNARVGNTEINGVKNRFNESHINENGQKLVDFCAQNELRINNTYFDHKIQHKITWLNTRGATSTIDYIITNRAVHTTQILDVRSLSSANIGSDHQLVLAKIRLNVQSKKRPPPVYVEKLNIESLKTESVKNLYKNRLAEKIRLNQIQLEEDVETAWKKVKENIENAANEALGKRKINKNANKTNTPWFTAEVKELATEKRESYLKYLSMRSPEAYREYKSVRNRVNSNIRRIKKEHWEAFTADIERDLYGAQKKVWGMLRRRKKEVNEYVQTNTISIQDWENHFRKLYENREDREAETLLPEVISTFISIELVENAVKSLKNRKAAGYDEIPNELIKYGGKGLHHQLALLFQKTITSGTIPTDWRKSLTIPISKRGINGFRKIIEG
ncbi:craniofacial development protein 2-like [Condylostylus longicornis]|uniref:craniofacial development protein 2-like n=1 Tax=Condylostylus longicornis TaxID=2530218 RepID=UPI00244DC938|nr:craniofacial development protein 2-like [Condylostylus longicornis]